MEHMPGGPPDHPHSQHEPSEQLHPLAESGDHLEKFAHSLEKITTQASEQAHEAEETKKKFLRAIKIDAYIIPLITVAGVALSIGASTYWNSIQQKNNRIYGQITEINEEIKERFALRDQLMNAMTQVRSVRDIGQLECNNGKYAGKNLVDLQEKLYSSEFRLIASGYSIVGIFNTNIENKIREFISYIDVDAKGICEKGAATDNELRSMQLKINNLILEEINLLKLEKKKLSISVEK